MNRFLLLMVLAGPAVLLADEVAAPPCEQTVSDDYCDCQCAHCGCQAHCQKCCHVVCDWKDVKETVYSCRCKEIAIPGRSEKCCTKYDECGPYNCPLTHDYKPLFTLWDPSDCCRTRSVTTLVKHQVTHKVPTYKWVVEYCCDKCCHDLDQVATTSSPDVPQPIAAERQNPMVSQQ